MSPSGTTLDARCPNRLRTKMMSPTTRVSWDKRTRVSTVEALDELSETDSAATKKRSEISEVARALNGGRLMIHPMPTQMDASAMAPMAKGESVGPLETPCRHAKPMPMAATTHDEAESALRATRTSFRHSANARYERL